MGLRAFHHALNAKTLKIQQFYILTCMLLLHLNITQALFLVLPQLFSPDSFPNKL